MKTFTSPYSVNITCTAMAMQVAAMEVIFDFIRSYIESPVQPYDSTRDAVIYHLRALENLMALSNFQLKDSDEEIKSDEDEVRSVSFVLDSVGTQLKSLVLTDSSWKF